MEKRGFINLMAVIILIAATAGILSYWYWKNSNISQPSTTPSSNVDITASSGKKIAVQTSTTDKKYAAPVCVFSAAPKEIILPQVSNLLWDCKNAQRCSIASDQGDHFQNSYFASGTLQVNPQRTTRYILSCSGTKGATSSFSAEITVKSPDTSNCGGLCE